MAKSKDQPAYLKEIIKKYGNIVIKGNQLLEQKSDYKVVSISPAIDMALSGGIREGSWMMLSGPPKCGKAQPYSSLVYTPTGPKMMGDMEVGDDVCTPGGGSAKVIGVYPQGTRKVYKITFSDGTSCRCDKDHLWKVQKSKTDEWFVKTSKELFLDVEFSDRPKWILPHVSLLRFNKAEQVIHPYILGTALRGAYISPQNRVLFHLKDAGRDKFVKLWTEQYGETKGLGERPVKCKQFLEDLEKINLKLTTKYKNIPDQYRYSTVEDRWELLQGYINNSSLGYRKIQAKNNQLLRNLFEVIKSLGFNPRIRKITNGLCVHLPPDFNTLEPLDLENNPPKPPRKVIKKIEEVHDELCQCIEIDSEDKLYVTDGLSATHNTTTAMQLAYHCQQEGRPIIYLNSEGRLNQLNFEVDGLDPEKMTIITAEDQPISAEVFLDVAHKLISVPENHGALCIIDSISSLIPEKDLDGEVTGSLRPGLPKILSNFVKKCGQIVPNNRNIMCMITHVIANTSGYGKSSMADGGIKIQFQADTRMEVKSITPWVNSDKTVRIGQAVKWTVYYSGLGAKNYECDSWIRYGKGIDKTQELLIMAMELGFISQAGAWMTCDFLYSNPQLLNSVDNSVKLKSDGLYEDEDTALRACKKQGQDKLYAFISENNKVRDYLFEQLKSVLN